MHLLSVLNNREQIFLIIILDRLYHLNNPLYFSIRIYEQYRVTLFYFLYKKHKHIKFKIFFMHVDIFHLITKNGTSFLFSL